MSELINMKRTILLLSFLAVFTGYSLEAQILEEKAQFSEKARGSAIFELNAGEHIYTYEPEDGWYKARKKVFLKPADVADNRLSAGAAFYDEEGAKIGQALEALRLYDIDTLKGFRSDTRLCAVVQGYVFETKIEDGSIPEEEISKILALKNRSEQQERFAELWEANDAESREFEGFEAQVIYETDKVSSEQKDFRLIVVFRGSSPYTIITNDHTVEIEKIKEFVEDGDFKIYYFYKVSDSQKEVMEDIIYTFLAL